MRADDLLQPWPFPAELAEVFRTAPMPAAELAIVAAGRLRALGSAALPQPAPALLEVMAAASSGATLGAVDARGCVMRLRCRESAVGLWQLEPVSRGQWRTLELLRAAVTAALGGAIVHELQGSLSAACLRMELMEHLLQQERASAQLRAGLLRQIEGLRERLNHLAAVQATLAHRWLALPVDAAAGTEALPLVLAEVTAPIRSHFARRGSSLWLDDAPLRQGCVATAAVPALRTGLCAALLTLLPDSEVAITVTIQGGVDAARRCAWLTMPRPDPGGAAAFAAATGWGGGELLAAVAFMLHGYGLRLVLGDVLRVEVPLLHGARE
ncbi:MAG: hypothetical protein AB1651_06265 [Pseudomonadota bacterium]